MGPLLTAEQLAELCNLSAEQIRRLTRDGAIPFHRIGGAVRYDFDAVKRATREKSWERAGYILEDLGGADVKLSHAKAEAARRVLWDALQSGEIPEAHYFDAIDEIGKLEAE